MDGVIPAPGLRYAATMGAVGLVAAALAGAVALTSGGASTTALMAAGCVIAGAMISVLPGVLRLSSGVQYWGMLVLGASFTRLLLTLGLALGLQGADGVSQRPFWLGVMSGILLHLIVETAIAVTILTHVERNRAGRARVTGSTERPTA